MSLCCSMGLCTLRAVIRLSASKAFWARLTRLTGIPQLFCQSSTTRSAMKVANDSFSQMSSHQTMVTRSPNQWWASSCAAISAYSLWKVGVSSLGLASMMPGPVGDQARRSPWRPGS